MYTLPLLYPIPLHLILSNLLYGIKRRHPVTTLYIVTLSGPIRSDPAPFYFLLSHLAAPNPASNCHIRPMISNVSHHPSHCILPFRPIPHYPTQPPPSTISCPIMSHAVPPFPTMPPPIPSCFIQIIVSPLSPPASSGIFLSHPPHGIQPLTPPVALFHPVPSNYVLPYPSNQKPNP